MLLTSHAYGAIPFRVLVDDGPSTVQDGLNGWVDVECFNQASEDATAGKRQVHEILRISQRSCGYSRIWMAGAEPVPCLG